VPSRKKTVNLRKLEKKGTRPFYNSPKETKKEKGGETAKPGREQTKLNSRGGVSPD